eukprot:248510_1
MADTRKSRMKKNLASKMAGSKAGRSVIINALGEEGAEIVATLKSIVGKFDGHKASKEFKQNVFKFALKAQIMNQEERIKSDPEKEHDIIKSGVVFLYALRDVCGPKSSSAGNPDLDEIVAAFNTMREHVLAFMSPHMREENTKVLDSLIGIICDRKFVEAVLCDPEYNVERESLFRNLELVFQPVDCSQYVQKEGNIEIRFDDKYSSAIEFVQSFWAKNLKGKDAELGALIIKNFCAKNADYASMLAKCNFGDTPAEQGEKISAYVSHIVKCLSAWYSFLQKELEDFAKTHAEWAPDMPQNAYDDLRVAIGESLKDMVGAKWTRGVTRSYDVVSDIVAQQFKVCFTE